jgi:DNA-binding MarR family transcriptional regulator
MEGIAIGILRTRVPLRGTRFRGIDWYGREVAARQKSQASAPARASVVDGVAWTTDLVRLEIALWDRVDARLRESHGLPLAFFEPLHLISRVRGDSLRVGDLARGLRITVGGTSKLVDRMEQAGLIAREPDRDDRRASRVALTTAGKRKLAAALKSYEAEVADILGGVLSPEEQHQMSDSVARLLASIDEAEET